MSIDASKYIAHRRPGKFEGESPATEYFYEQFCNGDGENICAGDGVEDIAAASLFQISAEEAQAFNRVNCHLPEGHWFLLREDSQGFAIGSVHPTRDAAEQAFQNWDAQRLR